MSQESWASWLFFFGNTIFQMTILPPIQEIFLSQVDLEHHPFFPFPDENLIRFQESLAVVGLLSLPRVRPQGSGRWQPVTGWKRLLAATQ